MSVNLINAGFMSSLEHGIEVLLVVVPRASSRSDESFMFSPRLSPPRSPSPAINARRCEKNVHRECASEISLRENVKRGCAWYFHAWIIGISCSMRRARNFFYRACIPGTLLTASAPRHVTKKLESAVSGPSSTGTYVTWKLDVDNVPSGTLCFLLCAINMLSRYCFVIGGLLLEADLWLRWKTWLLVVLRVHYGVM